MRVLVVAAHPDDEVLGPGGTIIGHSRAGDEVTIFLACCGRNHRYGTEEAGRLKEAAQKAGSLLGAKSVVLGDLQDQGLDALPLTTVIEPVERVMGEARPEIVYAHHAGDLNRDHRILAEAALVATRPPAAPQVIAVRCFETPSSTEWGAAAGLPPFLPQRFVDISATLPAKLEVLRLYESEMRPFPHPRSALALEARARTWGSASGLQAAEAFVIARERC